MNDDSKILRDIENMPKRLHLEGRMSTLENELDLKAMDGDDPVVKAAREMRYRVLNDLHERRAHYVDQSYESDWSRVVEKLKEADEAFWFAQRGLSGEQIYVSQAFDLKPIVGETPLYAEAREARDRIFWELMELKLDVLYYDPTARKKVIADLENRDVQFWYAHKEFSAQELIDFVHADADKTLLAAFMKRRFWLFLLGFLLVFWWRRAFSYFFNESAAGQILQMLYSAAFWLTLAGMGWSALAGMFRRIIRSDLKETKERRHEAAGEGAVVIADAAQDAENIDANIDANIE